MSCPRAAAVPSRSRAAAGTGASSPTRLTLFRAAITRRMHGERDTSAGDPFCIGYFVDNEFGWGDEVSLAEAALASPPEQAAKQVFLKDLETKYQTIENSTPPGTPRMRPGMRCATAAPRRTRNGRGEDLERSHAHRGRVLPDLPRRRQTVCPAQPVPRLPLCLGQ